MKGTQDLLSIKWESGVRAVRRGIGGPTDGERARQGAWTVKFQFTGNDERCQNAATATA
jgi:hypothetical protein